MLALAGLACAFGLSCKQGCGAGRDEPTSLEGLRSGGSLPLRAVDCPDGLARCEEGTVVVSRLATIPQPCAGPFEHCACPWDKVGDCPHGCAADTVELVMEAARAKTQLCAPGPDTGAFALPVTSGPPPIATCEEGERYRCSEGVIADCAAGAAVSRCMMGCVSEGASVDSDDVRREAAFAILCSR